MGLALRKSTDDSSRFTDSLRIRCPPFLPAAIDAAAARNLMTASEYVRRSVIDRLKADGTDPGIASAAPRCIITDAGVQMAPGPKIPQQYRHRRGLSCKGLMQEERILSRHDGQTGCVHIEVLPGPNLGQANALISTKINNRRIEELGTKLAHHQRGNPNIAIIQSN
jgi:hypothetical protein